MPTNILNYVQHNSQAGTLYGTTWNDFHQNSLTKDSACDNKAVSCHVHFSCTKQHVLEPPPPSHQHKDEGLKVSASSSFVRSQIPAAMAFLFFPRRNNILLIHFLIGSLQKLTTSLILSLLLPGRSLQKWQQKCFFIAQGSFCKAHRYSRDTITHRLAVSAIRH